MAWLTCSPDSVKKVKWTIMDIKNYLEKTLYYIRQCKWSIQMTTNHFLHNLNSSIQIPVRCLRDHQCYYQTNWYTITSSNTRYYIELDPLCTSLKNLLNQKKLNMDETSNKGYGMLLENETQMDPCPTLIENDLSQWLWRTTTTWPV